MGKIFLIAGLGNPGKEYACTRHNIGFMVTDLLAQKWKVDFHLESGFKAAVATKTVGEDKIMLCQPITWMNASGQAVGPLMRFYKVPQEQMLVILDDADLPVGKIRLRPGGSPGGHHGLESVIQSVGNDAVPRLKIGIGDAGQRRITGHVLGKFQKEEQPVIEESLGRASELVECWLTEGIQRAMNKFNGAVMAPEKRKTE